MEEEEPLEEEEIINETMFSFEALELVSLVFCLIMLQLNSHRNSLNLTLRVLCSYTWRDTKSLNLLRT